MSTNDIIDNISIVNGYGPISAANTVVFSGFNHRGNTNPVSANRDQVGIYFITRPWCNLSSENIAMARELAVLETSNKLTIQSYIRAVLDPQGVRDRDQGTPLLPMKTPFIPLLTNTLLSISGWPNPSAGVYETNPGMYGETTGFIDGIADYNGSFSLSLNFANLQGDPVGTLLNTLYKYSGLLRTKIRPYSSMILQRRQDYSVRVYGFLLDPSRRYVQKMCMSLGGFIESTNIADSFNVVFDERFVTNTEQVNANFKMFGARYNDPIIIEQFNSAVAAMEPELEIVSFNTEGDLRVKGSSGFIGSNSYIRIPNDELLKLNFEGLPLIHPITQELTWWVTTERYNEFGG